MKALPRVTLIVLLLFTGLTSVLAASCSEPVETVIPYAFPNGLINIIQHSENPDTPFWTWVEEKYPLFKANYTVQSDGWLEIYTYQFNGTRPEILLNGDETYSTMNPFYCEQVYAGDFVSLLLFPPEYLDSTFDVEVDNRAVTTYEVYKWDDLIGEIVFSETPRDEINVSISWTPVELVEDVSMVFSAEGVMEGYSWRWTLDGVDLHVDNEDSHFITGPLDYGDYAVTLFVEDMFGYNKTLEKGFTVEPNAESLLHEPSLTMVNVVDLYCPATVEPGVIMDATAAVSYTAPVSRDVQVLIVDSITGETLSILDDQLSGEGSKVYKFSFVSLTSDMVLEARAEFLHEDQWLMGEEFKTAVVSVVSPVEENSIPGFPLFAIALGLIYLLERKL